MGDHGPPPPPMDPPRQFLMSKAINPTGGGPMMAPPSSGPTVKGRDKILLDMQREVYDFYARVNPDKIQQEIFALALQHWWDSGLLGLNEILYEKYGQAIEMDNDILDDFDRDGEDVTIIVKSGMKAAAGRTHLVVKTMLKTNSGDFFHNDRVATQKKFDEAKEARNRMNPAGGGRKKGKKKKRRDN